MANEKNLLSNRNMTLGIALLGLGALFLVFNLLGYSSGALIVIFVGLGLFAAMVLLGKSFGWLAVPASVVTGVGLVLMYSMLYNILFPNHKGLSWVYTWTLFFAAAGMGILISHYWSGQPHDTRFGTMLVKASLVGFVGIGLIVESIRFLSSFLWPIALILIGGYLLLRARNGKSHADPKPRKVRSKSGSKAVEFEPLKTGEEEQVAAEAKSKETR